MDDLSQNFGPSVNWSPASKMFSSVIPVLFMKSRRLMYNLVQKETVQKHKVLHRDASPFNILIYEALDGVRGMLIDWEFAVEITLRAEYSVGGMVSMVFFMLGITILMLN